jgi:succinate dehydrogenase / fumarate reductase cytochrome b subunit
MKPLQLLFQSSIGKKIIMGATGAAMFLFVIGHLVGNLQVFLPKERINAYAHLLHANAGLLWVVRFSLLAIVGLHVWSAISLNAQNNSARPVAYGSGRTPVGASWASRYMAMTGLVIAAFVVYHLLHYTVQLKAINLTGTDFGSLVVKGGPQDGYKDVHQMLVVGFSHPLVSLFYLIAIALLCLHLSHGASAMFQSLGMQEGAWRTRMETSAKVISAALFAGYAAIPLGIFLRIVQ